ncbi:MAG TPA: TIGR01244 family sulfur transferase [Allosphingosinicella sp.]|nr:TIGR01244 family sulfur transferase [Allosphingosinicella sp.]
MDICHLSPSFAVSPQIRPADIGRLVEAGFKGIINNRPDGEAPEQPTSDEIEAEARRHGLFYRYIPVVPGQGIDAEARALAATLREADGPVLAFCRTGNRSSSLWKAAQQAS